MYTVISHLGDRTSDHGMNSNFEPVAHWLSFGCALCGHWFDLQWGRSQYTLLISRNKVETAAKWFRMSQTVLAGFSGHVNSIYHI